MEELNKPQQQAVLTTDGPLQILAGAGSGKTKVIINRIAHIINSGVNPNQILALTFTNKAANEMKTRLSSLLLTDDIDIWVGTFHSICLRILRVHADKIGYSRDFVIYDYYDQQTLIKDCMKAWNINSEFFKPTYFSSVISSAKDELMTPDKYEKENAFDIRTKTVHKVYKMYQERLKKNNAVDFDDMISLVIEIFKKHPEVLSFYQDKFKYILVDEYQDTNHAQYILVKILSEKHRNLCVVGDDDQAIYGWRGADIRNILNFSTDYPEATIVKLEQNYRSTENILNAANQVIKKNTGRKQKTLWTNKKSEHKIKLIKSQDDRMEAKNIVKEINQLLKNGYAYKDLSVLYRINSQSRLIEEELINGRVPYNIYGGLKFYDRKEIKDIMSYLRVLSNPSDDISLKRIINTPKRNIGARTVENIEIFGNKTGGSIYESLISCDDVNITPRAKNSIKQFLIIMGALKSMSEIISLPELIDKIVENTGYLVELEEEGEIEFQTRMENINELKSVAAEYEKTTLNPSLGDFLASVALSSDTDIYKESDDVVTLMTIHSSKGLEFPVVFIVGMEEGIFPTSRSLGSDIQIEEERRLCYVGMTRAKEELYLSYALGRNHFGKFTYQLISRFITDIPQELFHNPNNLPKIEKENYSLLDKYNKKKEIMAQIPAVDNFETNFSMGDSIEHPAFGKGKIVAKNDACYTIVFGNSGIKKIDLTFKNLRKC